MVTIWYIIFFLFLSPTFAAFYWVVLVLFAFDWIKYVYIAHWIERRICALSSYQSHQIQNVYMDVYSQPYFGSFALVVCLYASQNTICVWRFDKLTSSLDSLSCFCCFCWCLSLFLYVYFFVCVIVFTKISSYLQQYMGWERAMLWLLPNFMNNFTFRQYDGKAIRFPSSLSLIKQWMRLSQRRNHLLAFKQITYNIVANANVCVCEYWATSNQSRA